MTGKYTKIKHLPFHPVKAVVQSIPLCNFTNGICYLNILLTKASHPLRADLRNTQIDIPHLIINLPLCAGGIAAGPFRYHSQGNHSPYPTRILSVFAPKFQLFHHCTTVPGLSSHCHLLSRREHLHQQPMHSIPQRHNGRIGHNK